MDRKVKNLLEAFTREERLRFYRAAERQAADEARDADSPGQREQALQQVQRWRGLLEQVEQALKPWER